MPTAAILISRQSIRPSKRSAWIKAAIKAVKWVKNQGFTLLTSEGLQTYELQIYLSVLYQLNQHIILPVKNIHDFLSRYYWLKSQFDLSTSTTVFIPVTSELRKADLQKIRDKYIVEKADILIPVSIRKNGGMFQLLKKAVNDKRTINTDFEMEYENDVAPVKYTIHKENFNAEINNLKEDYLIHWTRASSYAWPGERLQKYYQALILSDIYPRSAFHSLLNILNTRTIRASMRHMPKNTKVVSFTGHTPVQFVSLMIWRSRYIEMSFEPYGIGIKRTVALNYGIKPVIYTDNNTKKNKDNWLSHSIGKAGNWPLENEYRFNNDVNLSCFLPEHLICFCLTPREADFIEHNYFIKAVSFY